MKKITTLCLAALSLCAVQSFAQEPGTAYLQNPAPVVIGPVDNGHGATAGDGMRARTVSASQRPTLVVNEIWQNNAWHNSTRTTFGYDAAGRQISNVTESWDAAADTWKNDSRTQYTYDNNGNMLVMLNESWNAATSEWVNENRTTNTYNAAKKVAVSLNESWESGAWQNMARIAYTYDGSGYLTKTLAESWDTEAGRWEVVQQTIFTNNSNGTVAQSMMQMWDEDSEAWTDFYRTTFTYNAAGQVTHELSEMGAGGTWMPWRRTAHTYDGRGYLTTYLEEGWDILSNAWKNSMLTEYTNNNDGEPTMIVRDLWNAATSGWDHSFRSTLTYAGVADVPGAHSTEPLNVYPNPGHGRFTVRLSGEQMYRGEARVEVYNTLGEVVMQSPVTGTEARVDLTGRPEGMYFVRLVNGGNAIVAQQKVVVAGPVAQ